MIAENGGIDVVLQCISDTGMQNNKAAAIALCSLLSKVSALFKPDPFRLILIYLQLE